MNEYRQRNNHNTILAPCGMPSHSRAEVASTKKMFI